MLCKPETEKGKRNNRGAKAAEFNLCFLARDYGRHSSNTPVKALDAIDMALIIASLPVTPN